MPLSEEELKVIAKLASIPVQERNNIIANTIRNLSLAEAVEIEFCFRRLFLILDNKILAAATSGKMLN